MSDSGKPLITVLGALSKQGRSVVQTLLESGRYRVRALTRHIDSAEAKSLAKRGAELMNVPLQSGKRDSLADAFRGSHGVFLMTPPIAPPETHETALGKQMADAAVEAGVQHIVFSALENVDAITNGGKWAPHFTDKAKVEEYIRTLPVASSFIYLAFFYTNFLEYYPPHLDGDTLVFPIYLPEHFKAPFVDPLTATGPAVLEIFDRADEYVGKSLPVIGEFISPHEMVETFAKVTGKKAVYRPAFSRDGLIQNFPAIGRNEDLVREILGMAEYAVEYGYYQQHRDMTWSRRVNPDTLTWEEFLRESQWQGNTRTFSL
jgi:uncharacterized protein YbjT (DUF2867 family)